MCYIVSWHNQQNPDLGKLYKNSLVSSINTSQGGGKKRENLHVLRFKIIACRLQLGPDSNQQFVKNQKNRFCYLQASLACKTERFTYFKSIKMSQSQAITILTIDWIFNDVKLLVVLDEIMVLWLCFLKRDLFLKILNAVFMDEMICLGSASK